MYGKVISIMKIYVEMNFMRFFRRYLLFKKFCQCRLEFLIPKLFSIMQYISMYAFVHT